MIRRLAPGQEAVLQIGFSTALATDRQQLRPVNLALVIDKSGSMADADKISRVKSALLALVSQLRDTDTLSIVVFDTGAQVLLTARSLADRLYIEQLIRDIVPGGFTNIHEGLMAQAIRDMAAACEARRYQESNQEIDASRDAKSCVSTRVAAPVLSIANRNRRKPIEITASAGNRGWLAYQKMTAA